MYSTDNLHLYLLLISLQCASNHWQHMIADVRGRSLTQQQVHVL